MIALAIIFRRQLGYTFSEFSAYLDYPFIQRALVVGLSVSLCASVLGVCLVLKRYSMIGDGLSHVGFGALALAMALGYVNPGSPFHTIAQRIADSPMVFTTAVVMLLAFLLLKMNSSARIKGDAAIAMLSTSALAFGVAVVSFTEGMNIDISNYMFGSILAVSGGDVVFVLVVSAVEMILMMALYHRFFAVTFDETFARATGVKAGVYNMLLAGMTALTVVMGMRLMGTMLISGLIIFPALTAMRVFSRFRTVMTCSACVSVVCFMLGLMLSCVYSLPAGAAVMLMNLLFFAAFSLIKKLREM